MKPIKIQNEHGETIEIKYDDDGVIKIRHSDIDPKTWAELHEYSKRIRQPEIKAAMEAKGVLDTPEAKELAARFGGYVIVRGKSYIVNFEEVALIHEAVKQAGGIVPNWSSRA
jgi:hypothetical protein